ncbi:hypothetical protein [Pseudomonas sp. DE0157]|uniref:hypothetical protein n=1 Tax=Pseudomonas sp. DE0157 TaxID=2584952 RepID=UPI00119E5397|nr:hypothetical protein [Pseudomonas sp. DE0157]
MRRYHWIDTPQSIEYCVMYCVEDAPGFAQHFQHQLSKKGRDFTVKQISAALQRLKKDGLVSNKGSFWQMPEVTP